MYNVPAYLSPLGVVNCVFFLILSIKLTCHGAKYLPVLLYERVSPSSSSPSILHLKQSQNISTFSISSKATQSVTGK